MIEPTFLMLLGLGAVAFVAGFVDSIAGGGGLITIPFLLSAGLSPLYAFGTNKLQGCVASFSATIAYARAGLIHWRSALPFAFAALIGGAFGTISVELIPTRWLQLMVPVMLVIVAIYFALMPRLGDSNVHARLSAGLFAFVIPLPIGFYDGVFGPGAGSFYMVGFVTLLGYGIVQATAHTKLVNLGSNFASFIVFFLKGYVILPIGLSMALGSFLGAQLGSRVAARVGARLIRPVLVVVCFIMAVKLLTAADNPLHVLIAGWFN